MRIAVVGSRTATVENLESYLPSDVSEIVSGGARGIDLCAAEYAEGAGLRLTVFLPEYERYGWAAPLKRNDRIAEYADACLAFWDGASRGTQYTISQFRKRGKSVCVFKRSVDDGNWYRVSD